MIQRYHSLVPGWLRLALKVAHDLFMISAAWVISFFIRANLSPTTPLMNTLLETALPVILAQISVLVLMGAYHRIWRYTSLQDLWHLARMTAVAVAASVAVVYMISPVSGMPRSVLIIDGLLLILFLGGGRILYRSQFEGLHRRHRTGPRTLIVGAGRSGTELLRSLLADRKREMQVVGLIDDDLQKRGATIFGVRVIGTVEDLGQLIPELLIEQVLIAIPAATGAEIQRIINHCEQTDAIVKTIPSYAQIAEGKGRMDQIRTLEIADILNRPPVELDTEPISSIIAGRTVLVSGAGGSIGSELCRQVMKFSPRKLVLVDNSEYLLYRIDAELGEQYDRSLFCAYPANVGDGPYMDRIFSAEAPQVVVHAAAYKHVPMMEAHPRAALVNNIGGTMQIASCAQRHGVDTFVLISTDKAVNPTNIMGATKRLAEITCQALQAQGGRTRFITVRFGNVLASNGSVVPLFLSQIRKGGPVTVTHPEMTRFFMSISEASLLVLTASALGKGGEIFVLDMGEQVKIIDLARALIRIQGKIPGRDIPIEITGLRPGEKLFEELFTPDEKLTATAHRKIRVASSRAFTADILEEIRNLVQQAEHLTLPVDPRAAVKRLIPEYTWQEAEETPAGGRTFEGSPGL